MVERGKYFQEVVSALVNGGIIKQQKDIADFLKVSEPTVSGWLNRGIATKHLDEFTSHYSINAKYLRSGQGEMFTTGKTEPAPTERKGYLEERVSYLEDQLKKLEAWKNKVEEFMGVEKEEPVGKKEHKPVPFTTTGKSKYDKMKEITARKDTGMETP